MTGPPRNSRETAPFRAVFFEPVILLEKALFSSVSYDHPLVIPVILIFRFDVTRFMAKGSEDYEYDRTGHTSERVPTAVEECQRRLLGGPRGVGMSLSKRTADDAGFG